MVSRIRHGRQGGMGFVGVIVVVAAIMLGSGLLAKLQNGLFGSTGPSRTDRGVRQAVAVMVRPMQYPDGAIGAGREIVESFRLLTETPANRGR